MKNNNFFICKKSINLTLITFLLCGCNNLFSGVSSLKEESRKINKSESSKDMAQEVDLSVLTFINSVHAKEDLSKDAFFKLMHSSNKFNQDWSDSVEIETVGDSTILTVRFDQNYLTKNQSTLPIEGFCLDLKLIGDGLSSMGYRSVPRMLRQGLIAPARYIRGSVIVNIPYRDENINGNLHYCVQRISIQMDVN